MASIRLLSIDAGRDSHLRETMRCGGRILTFVHNSEHGSHLRDTMRCGGQDSNLRTNKEWDLNPPPLTKLGDPRADWGRRLLDLKQAIHWDAEKPAFSITVMISCAEMFSVVVMVPLSVACDTSAPITSGWFSRTPLSRLEQPPQLMPVI